MASAPFKKHKRRSVYMDRSIEDYLPEDLYKGLISISTTSFFRMMRANQFILEDDSCEIFQGKFADVLVMNQSSSTPCNTIIDCDEEPSSQITDNTITDCDATYLSLKNCADVAVKSQIMTCSNTDDPSYRELLVYRTLTDLVEKYQLTPGFVTLRQWFKSCGNVEDTDSEDEENKDKLDQRKRKQKRINPERFQYMNFVLEKAETNMQNYLLDFDSLPVEMYRSMLFQLLFALYMAQKHLEFVHNDLHFKNILLKKLDSDVDGMAFTLEGTCWYSDCKNMPYVVKLNDFGLSRIKIDDNFVLHSPKLSKVFDANIDISKIASELVKIKIDWTGCKDEEYQREVHKSLRRKMKNITTETLRQLLDDTFFDPMLAHFDDHGIRHRKGKVLRYGEHMTIPKTVSAFPKVPLDSGYTEPVFFTYRSRSPDVIALEKPVKKSQSLLVDITNNSKEQQVGNKKRKERDEPSSKTEDKPKRKRRRLSI